jgi:hypothetical protein
VRPLPSVDASDLEVADELQRRATEVDIERRLSGRQRTPRAMSRGRVRDLGNTIRDPARSRSPLGPLPETSDQRARTMLSPVDSIRRSTTRMRR